MDDDYGYEDNDGYVSDLDRLGDREAWEDAQADMASYAADDWDDPNDRTFEDEAGYDDDFIGGQECWEPEDQFLDSYMEDRMSGMYE